MANFDAHIVGTYRDVPGLVLSCAREDIVEDPSNPGYAIEWINRAPGLPSKPMFRNPGTAATYNGGRYSNFTQADPAFQPAIVLTGGGEKRLNFERARSTFMSTEAIPNRFPDGARRPAVALQYTSGADVSNDQAILYSPAGQRWYRRNGAGVYTISLGASTLTGGAPLAGGTHLAWSEVAPQGVTLDTAGVSVANSGAGNSDDENAGNVYYVGSSIGAGYLDGILDQVHVWMSELSPRARDFIWKSLNADGNDYSSGVYATMSRSAWTDVTGSLSAGQIDRVRPFSDRPFMYYLGTLPGGVSKRVQLICSVEGMLVPDSRLGGKLFSYSFLEWAGPGPTPPAISQDSGWSALADFQVVYPGHYTVIASREEGGSIIVHFDMQETP